jgi:hypothetical protein
MSYDQCFFTGTRRDFDETTGYLTGRFTAWHDGDCIGTFTTARAARAALSRKERQQ